MFFQHRIQKKQAAIVIDIARDYLKNLSDSTSIYAEEDKRFIWNLYSLEQYINKSSYWKIKKGQLSPNDGFLYNIIQYLIARTNKMQGLSPEKQRIYDSLLERLEY